MTIPDTAIQHQLDSIRDGYLRHLPAQIQELAARWQILAAGAWSPEYLNPLYREAHTLAGSAASVGFHAVGAAAQQLADLLAHLSADSASQGSVADRATVDAHLLALQATAHQTQEAMRRPPLMLALPAPERATRQTTVLIVEDDPASGDHLALLLEHFGYRATVIRALDGLAAAVRAHAPAAIILDIVFPEGDLAGPQYMAAAAQVGAETPVIFLSRRNDFEARLWAVRTGGKAYLTKPVDIDALVSVLDTLTGAFVPEPYRILIVDDSRMMSTLYEAMLREAGMRTLPLNDPAQVLPTLHEFQPDLLLLDMYMPSCTGPEVAAIIRQQAAFVSLPIVFLSGERDRDHQLAALNQGGDDFLTKPITAPRLVSAVTSRARRARALRAQLSRDGLTGLLTHASIKEQAVREISRAQRYGTALTVAMIDLDYFKQVNDRYGHAAGDRVLKGLARLLHQRLRMSDSIGRYGGEEFLILLPQTDGPTALHVLDDARARFATIGHQFGEEEVTVTFSAGMASLPQSGDGRALLAAADDALYAAKRAGRNQIMSAPDLDTGDAHGTAA
jgi:diguanylate cyclase (GGDEF)-like protein